MFVGEAGIGKTTLIESLFNMKIDCEETSTNKELNSVKLLTKICG